MAIDMKITLAASDGVWVAEAALNGEVRWDGTGDSESLALVDLCESLLAAHAQGVVKSDVQDLEGEVTGKQPVKQVLAAVIAQQGGELLLSQEELNEQAGELTIQFGQHRDKLRYIVQREKG